MADLEFNAGASAGRIRLNIELDSAVELNILEEVNEITTAVFSQISAPEFSKQLAYFNSAQVGQELDISWLVATYTSFLNSINGNEPLDIEWPTDTVASSLATDIYAEKLVDLSIAKPELVKQFCWLLLFDYLVQRFPGVNFVVGDGSLHYSIGNWELPIINPITENEIYIQAAGECFIQLLQYGRNERSTILLARGLSALKLAQVEKLMSARPALPLQTIYEHAQQNQIELWELTKDDLILDLIIPS